MCLPEKVTSERKPKEMRMSLKGSGQPGWQGAACLLPSQWTRGRKGCSLSPTASAWWHQREQRAVSVLITFCVYLYLVVLCRHCCMCVFFNCSEWGLLFVVCAGFVLWWLLLLWSMGSRAGFNSCGTQASLLRGLGDLPRPGIEPVFPALAGRFLTTGPLGRSVIFLIGPVGRDPFCLLPTTASLDLYLSLSASF